MYFVRSLNNVPRQIYIAEYIRPELKRILRYYAFKN